MDNHLLTILKVELLSQAELAQVAGEQLGAAHEKKLEGRMRRDDEFWVALQSILTIAGNASKLLWGSWGNEATAARRQPLRELVGVSDNSPLRSRDVRNAFEHFDDEVETWHRAGDIDVYASRQIGTDAVYPPANSRFGYYNPRTRVVTFLKWSASIPDLLAELERIRVALQS